MVPLLGRRCYWGVDGAVMAVHLAEIFVKGDLTSELWVFLVNVGVVLPSRGVFFGIEQHLLRIDKVRPREVGQLVLGAQADRINWTGFLAVAAEDAADHVDLVDRRIPLTSRCRMSRVVVGRLDEDGTGRTGRRAQLAADAALEAVGGAVQP